MKKFLVLVLASSILTGLFAQENADKSAISVSGWGQTAINPLLYYKTDGQDGTIFAGVGSAWDNLLDFELYITGGVERVGFEFDISYFSSTSVSIGNNAYVWVKPFDWLKVNAGRFDDNYLRGKLGDPNFSYAVLPYGVENKNATFNRFRVRNGAELVLTPVNGLYAAVAITGDIDALVRPSDTSAEAKDVYEGVQAALGYAISNIGLARAQYIGGDKKAIEAAFAFTGKDGLILDLGTKIQVDNDNPHAISLRGKYSTGNFSTLAYIDTKLGGDALNNSILGFYIEPSYNIGKVILGLDFDLKLGEHTSKDEIELTNLGAGLWALKNFATNGSIQIGLAFIAPLEGNSQTISVGIPIILEYSF
jgi:hypothetical protein